jgi:type IV fimbrial biogenesis protein FimT
MKRMRRPGAAGFSLIEILIVVVVLLVIAALAIPSMTTTIANYRLRGAASNVGGIVQTARMRTIHDNQFYSVRVATWNNARVAYVDLNGNSQYDVAPTAPDKPEPAAQLPSGVSVVTGGGPSTSTMNLGTGWTTLTTAPTFGAQGLPCTVSGGVCQRISGGSLVGYIVYVTDARGAWAAVTVTPAARIKTWLWRGSIWTN